MKFIVPMVALALAACTQSINQAAKASVDQSIALMSQSSEVYEPPTSAEPIPLAVGQWVK